MARHCCRHKDLSRSGRLQAVGRITLVKKRCAWYLRVNLKPHSELPYAEGEDFLEVMLLDRGAGARLVEEGGSSSSRWSSSSRRCRGECAGERFVAPSAPKGSRLGRAHSQRACGVQDLVSRVLHLTWSNAPTPCRRKRNRDSSNCHCLRLLERTR